MIGWELDRRKALLSLTCFPVVLGGCAPLSPQRPESAGDVDADLEGRLRAMKAAYVAHDLEGFSRYLAEDVIFEDVTFQMSVSGKAPILDMVRQNWDGHASYRQELENVIVAAPWVVTQQRDIGTYKAGQQRPERSYSVRGASFIEWRSGQVIRWTDYYDALGMQAQLRG